MHKYMFMYYINMYVSISAFKWKSVAKLETVGVWIIDVSYKYDV